MPDAPILGDVVEALMMVERVKFVIAGTLRETRDDGSWTKTVYPEGHKSAGKKPGSFTRYLEAFGDSLFSALPGGMPLPEMRERIAQIDWLVPLGFTVDELARIGFYGCKALRVAYEKLPPEEAAERVRDALAELSLYGRFISPVAPKPAGHVSVALDGIEEDAAITLSGITLTKDGVRYRNKFPKELAHWLAKRLRAIITLSPLKES